MSRDEIQLWLADRFVKDGPVRFVGCYLAALLGRSPIAEATMRAWMKSRDEFRREIGYGIFCVRLKDNPGSCSEVDAEKILAFRSSFDFLV